MKIKDLKFGDVLIARNGLEYVVFDFDEDRECVSLACRIFGKDWGGQTYGSLINNDLTGSTDKDNDIIFVYRPMHQGHFSLLFFDEKSYKAKFCMIYDRAKDERKAITFLLSGTELEDIKRTYGDRIISVEEI